MARESLPHAARLHATLENLHRPSKFWGSFYFARSTHPEVYGATGARR
jgi:hypothetical protein